MAKKPEKISKREAMTLGAIGGALVGLPSYVIAGDILNTVAHFDLAVLVGLVVRVPVFAGIGVLYAYLMPLPAEKWTAIERGVMAPAIVVALIFNHMPDSKSLDKDAARAALNVSIMGSAYAGPPAEPADKDKEKPAADKDKETPAEPSTVRQFIRGLIGK